ncbi:MAG: hypothetical protein U0894_03090 [Pirellulales bacterium]
MRLDIFLPFLRKAKKGAPPPVDGWLLRLAKLVFPAALFSDRITGKPGLARRWLKQLGPSWLSCHCDVHHKRPALHCFCFLLPTFAGLG